MLILTQQDGQGLIEYAFILLLVSKVVLLVLVVLGPQVGSLYSQITSSIGVFS